MIRFGRLVGEGRPWQGQLFVLLALFAGGVGLWRLFVCAFGGPADLAFLPPADKDNPPERYERIVEQERQQLPRVREALKRAKHDPAEADRNQEKLDKILADRKMEWDKATRDARLKEGVLAVFALAVAALLAIKARPSRIATGPP